MLTDPVILFQWLLAVFGVTIIITISKIFLPIRAAFLTQEIYEDPSPHFFRKIRKWIGELLHCAMCMGFWVGMGAGYFWLSPTQNIFIDGILGSAFSWLLYTNLWTKNVIQNEGG